MFTTSFMRLVNVWVLAAAFPRGVAGMVMVMFIFMSWFTVVSMIIPSSGSNHDTPEALPSEMAHGHSGRLGI